VTRDEVMAELEKLGNESTKRTLTKHGAREPFFGVRVGDLKTLVKKIKVDHALALELYDTGNSDAMYLAALIADPMAFTKPQLKKWAKGAYWYMLSGFTVPWSASESKFGRELALEWIDGDSEQVQNAGWCTYASLVSIKPDADLDFKEIEALMGRVKKEIGSAPNRARYAMNTFVIAVGSYVAPLLAKAKAAAKALGEVEVDTGDTSCQVPVALEYIEKVERAGRVGKKRKRASC
jgi:3-methyladenine DNA glycosylase AlkD